MSVRQRRGNTNDSRRYFDWLDRAGEDLVAASLLLKDDFTYNPAAFHCQQTIEKSLKAYILLKSKKLVDGHNLTWLTRQAARYNKTFEKWLGHTGPLNRTYIETRYPADIPVALDYKMVTSFYAMAKEMFLLICAEVDGMCEEDLEEGLSLLENATLFPKVKESESGEFL